MEKHNSSEELFDILFNSNFADLPDFVEFMHNVYRSHLVSRRRIPMTACPSYKLTQVT